MADSARQRLRRAVRSGLTDIGQQDLVLVGCSGGPDSIALARVVADIAVSGGPRAGAIVVDHQLQPGSADVAEDAATQCREFGLDPVVVETVDVDPGSGLGPEGSARQARRSAMLRIAREFDAAALLLAHTLDDQAETVLLRLSRGASARTLSSMARADGIWRRPLLDSPRVDTHALVDELGLKTHTDPHNSDPEFARVRVRNDALPALEAALGQPVVGNLARSADLLRRDNEALDLWASAQAEARIRQETDGSIAVALTGESGDLSAIPVAVRTRIARLALIAGGCPPGSITTKHLLAFDDVATNGLGRGPTRVPGDREVARMSDRVLVYQAGPLSKRDGVNM